MTAFQEGRRHVVDFIHGMTFAMCRQIAQRQES
jgi:hypothetical protein